MKRKKLLIALTIGLLSVSHYISSAKAQDIQIQLSNQLKAYAKTAEEFKEYKSTFNAKQLKQIEALEKDKKNIDALDIEILSTGKNLEQCAKHGIISKQEFENYNVAFMNWRYMRNSEQDKLWAENAQKRAQLDFIDQEKWRNALFADHKLSLLMQWQLMSQMIEKIDKKSFWQEQCPKTLETLAPYKQTGEAKDMNHAELFSTLFARIYPEICLPFFLNTELHEQGLKKYKFTSVIKTEEAKIKQEFGASENSEVWLARTPYGMIYIIADKGYGACIAASETVADEAKLKEIINEFNATADNNPNIIIKKNEELKNKVPVAYEITIKHPQATIPLLLTAATNSQKAMGTKMILMFHKR